MTTNDTPQPERGESTAITARGLDPTTLQADPAKALELPLRHLDYMLEVVAMKMVPEDRESTLWFVNPTDDMRHEAADVPEYSASWSHMRGLFRVLRQGGFIALLAQHEDGRWSCHVYAMADRDKVVTSAMADDAPEASATAILQALLPAWTAPRQQQERRRR